MAKTLQIEFPESTHPEKLGFIGIGEFDDDATQFEAVQRLALWAGGSFAGTENRTHLAGTGPVCLSFKELP